jgi:hypothetical protein
MAALLELQPQALSLCERERAQLAAILLRSLPAGVEDEDDDGVAEALRREEESAADPSALIPQKEFDERMRAWMNR